VILSVLQPKRPVALALVILLAVPLSALSAEETGTKPPVGDAKVKAKVLKSDGKTSLAGATLRGYHLDTGQVFSSSPTNAKGECEITGLPHGYFDLTVETEDGVFVGNQVVNVPPSGSAVLSFTLTNFAERSAAWWSGKTQREIPGTNKPSQGIAEIRLKPVGREFWTSPKGIAVIGGAAAAVLLLLASGGGGSSGSSSPSTP
jgi:hypothetical protein